LELIPVSGIFGLSLRQILGCGAVDAMIWTDGPCDPLADHIPLYVIESGAGRDRDEGVLERQRLKYRLVGE